MSTIPIELPDHLQSYVDESAEQVGFASASEYIVALVAAASEKQGEIEQALVAGIKSGSAEQTTGASTRHLDFLNAPSRVYSSFKKLFPTRERLPYNGKQSTYSRKRKGNYVSNGE